jgi:hypothetical protein
MRCGSRPNIDMGKAVSMGEESEKSTPYFHRGIGGGMYTEDRRGNTGSPRHGSSAGTNRRPVTDRLGVAGWRIGP